MGLPEPGQELGVDVESSGLFKDDGATLSCLAVAWWGDGEVKSLGLPFDQGLRDKFAVTQLNLLDGGEDPNLGEGKWEETLMLLANSGLVFHNAKFDLSMLAVGTRRSVGENLLDQLVWDTMVGAHELDSTQSMELDNVAQRAGLRGKESKDRIKQWLKANKFPLNRIDLAPWDLVEPYVRQDAELALKLKEIQADRFDSGEASWNHFDREMDLLRVLYKMENRGVAFEAGQALEAADKLENEANRIEAEMPFKCNVNAAKRWFIGKEGLHTDRLTEKGKPSLDAEQAERWAREGVKWAKEYGQVVRMRRAVSMYYRGYPEKLGSDGRLRTSYKQCKVKSGRMSVERVNLQALPTKRKDLPGVPGVRTLLRARGGYRLWSLDLSQAELRVAAKYAGCDHMLEMVNNGVDMHGRTAERVLRAKRTMGDWKAHRDVAKRLNFASIFLVGGETFQQTLIKEMGLYLDLRECENLVVGWRREYPEFERAYKKAEGEVRRRGFIMLLPGTEWEIPSWFAEHEDWHKGWSRKVQGSLAEFFKRWMIQVEELAPGAMVLTVHDSVLLELPAKDGESTAMVVAAAGAELATEAFKTEMRVDVDEW